ncbi:hypothetical protein [Spartinivicinus marinus]|nr:hypothetical protein [Spartinivicinus marinus]MCX4026874.1 hypothetical protein [Spartinivicinus marinus]
MFHRISKILDILTKQFSLSSDKPDVSKTQQTATPECSKDW